MDNAILVTGGSGAIGAATCEALAARGFMPVVGYASGRERAEAIAARTGGLALACDMADDISIDSAVARLAAETVLAGVVLAASPPPNLHPFTKAGGGELERQWRVNVAGPQRLLAALIKSCFRPRRSGVAVAVLTRAMGLDGTATSGMAEYVVAKYGLLGVIKAVAAEYSWLRTGWVTPGFVETPMLAAFDPRYLEQARATQPFAPPADIAAEIVAKVIGP